MDVAVLGSLLESSVRIQEMSFLISISALDFDEYTSPRLRTSDRYAVFMLYLQSSISNTNSKEI